MAKLRAFLAGAVIAALASAASAQPVTIFNLTGNECWNAGNGPGGPSAGFVCAYATRGTIGTVLNNGANPVTMNMNQSNLVLTAQPAAAANITLPPSPVPDGMVVEIINGTTGAFATNVFSIVPNTGQTLLGGNIALTTLAAGASKELRYSVTTNTWYPVR